MANATLAELKQTATALGITADDARAFGHIGHKATWIDAIDAAHAATTVDLESELTVEDCKAWGVDPAFATASENTTARFTFAQVCAIVEREENFAIAAVFVSVWLINEWLRLLIWLAPHARYAGVYTRELVEGIATRYSAISYAVTHKGSQLNTSEMASTQTLDTALVTVVSTVAAVAHQKAIAIANEAIACYHVAGRFYLAQIARVLAAGADAINLELSPAIPVLASVA